MPTDPTFDGLDPEVRALLDAARHTSSVTPDSGLIAAMTAAVAEGPLNHHSNALPRRKSMLGKVITAKALALAGALVLTGGVAAAATGGLPDAAQNGVSHAADNVGIHIPEGNHGAAVSDAAHNKDVTGKNHGQDVSTVARDNHGHDGTNGKPSGDDTSPGNSADHRQDGEHRQDGTHEGDDESTPAVDETTTTTVKDHPNHGQSGEHTDAPESEHPAGSGD